MKKTDIAMVVLIAGISMLIAFLVADQISFLKPPQKGESIKTIDRIDPNVPTPDPNVFSSSAINPTVQTVIGGGQAAQ